jgi:hypothetical protein
MYNDCYKYRYKVALRQMNRQSDVIVSIMVRG